jgi:tRNA U34 5-carboxymethylaminomethyl modifying GTPase MnmE/TrmE
MIMSNINDTIAAIATPIGESGIGIVRISGRDALSVADKIFVSKDGRKSPNFKTYTTHYGWIVSGRRPQAASYKQTAKNLQPVACSMQQDIVD